MSLNYSVLMSVYYKENPKHLAESIESMLNQTIKTNDFVLVCDGKLTPGLMSVLEKYADNPIMNIVYLEKNVGLGEALNIAMPYCKNELIARMDSDDTVLFRQSGTVISGTCSKFFRRSGGFSGRSYGTGSKFTERSLGVF